IKIWHMVLTAVEKVNPRSLSVAKPMQAIQSFM
ncbi:hypothetical protein FOCG_18551, partial [Fusarium oxysporum f. sp. radicis-lycopersici 26381]